MAGKKKEMSLQVAITNQEQWDELLTTKGLIVVDVYQQWCGPCRAVLSLFRKIKNELGDDLLHFATAEADSINSLERYRGKCEPTFLFYGGGSLVALLRGANGPLLQKMVLEELEQEKRVLEQGAQRRVVETEPEVIHNESSDGYQPVPAHKSYTVAVIKPDAVAHDKVYEIITKVQAAGFEIVAQEARNLTRAEAEVLYQHKAAEPDFEELVQFTCGGPSHVLLISHLEELGDVIQALQEYIGTATMKGDKEAASNSLRGHYSIGTLSNVLHCSSDRAQASRELALFFPSFTSSFAHSREEVVDSSVERTLALIPPVVTRDSREDIILRIQAAGLSLAMKRELVLTEEQVGQFYGLHLEEDCFTTLLQNLTSGPILALVLSGPGAVQKWRSMLGCQTKQEPPDSLIAELTALGEPNTLFHGSHSAEQAEQEIQIVFPPEQTLALIKPDTIQEHRDEILKEIRGGGFSILQMMEVCLSQAEVEKLYRELLHKPFFNQLVDFMCCGPCMALILSKHSAVEEWKAMMGPTDPCLAQETVPGSLRARFGKDVLHNAVHGSSSPQHAEEDILLVFKGVHMEDDHMFQLQGKEAALDRQVPLEEAKVAGLGPGLENPEPIDLHEFPVRDEMEHAATSTVLVDEDAGEGNPQPDEPAVLKPEESTSVVHPEQEETLPAHEFDELENNAPHH